MFKDQTAKSLGETKQNSGEYDLEERTARWGEFVIKFCRRQIKFDPITSVLVKQVVRSATSVGANYCEACEAGTRKEFRYRISLCKRESRESKHWLRMLATACENEKDEIRNLWKEADELTRIFAAIFRNSPEEETKSEH